MYKEEFENVVIYIICYKKEGMELIESYYDQILDKYYLYFNGYLAYKSWKHHFKDLPDITKEAKELLTLIANKYLTYELENELHYSKAKHEKLKQDIFLTNEYV